MVKKYFKELESKLASVQSAKTEVWMSELTPGSLPSASEEAQFLGMKDLVGGDHGTLLRRRSLGNSEVAIDLSQVSARTVRGSVRGNDETLPCITPNAKTFVAETNGRTVMRKMQGCESMRVQGIFNSDSMEQVLAEIFDNNALQKLAGNAFCNFTGAAVVLTAFVVLSTV